MTALYASRPGSRAVVVVALASFLASCIEPAEVAQIGRERYAVSVQVLNIEGGDAEVFDKALSTASNYCTQLGLKANLESVRTDAMSVAAGATAVFQCIPASVK
ncbi:MAG: hypothetical protein ABSD74_03680 [Rhizomicrobium sp.]|jgi:hypothetical protein